ncbi:hypothetical protein CCHR01_03486 [Colletotrichum chrysophilum]|uniref:Uncharacterized protein n=1 Tax=Colletotrichum chrysophilum TaxID=1836956 RepID=A0AAD9ENH9_9PEZI|nr:hypothetical protein CCHR01_03486 [Colletotrichum chrysophilum]
MYIWYPRNIFCSKTTLNINAGSDKTVSSCQQHRVSQDLETRRQIPRLVDVIPPRPHVLHHPQGGTDAPKHLQGAHLADHLAEHVLLRGRREAADHAKWPDDGAQAHGGVQRVEQLDGGGDAGRGLGAGGLPAGDDGGEVRQRGVGPDLGVDQRGGAGVADLLALVEGQRVGREAGGVGVRGVRRRAVGVGEGAGAGGAGELGGAEELRAGVVHAGYPLAQGELEAAGAGYEVGHGEGAGAAGFLLPGVEGGDLADELEDPGLAAEVLLEAQAGLLLEAGGGLFARGEEVGVVALETRRALEGGGGDDVEVEEGSREKAEGGLVGGPGLVGSRGEVDALEEGDGHLLHGGVPGVGGGEDLGEDDGGGVEVHLPVVVGCEGDVEDEELDDGLEDAAGLLELGGGVAGLVDEGHVGAELLEGEVELVLEGGDGADAAGGVLDLGAVEDDAEEVGGEGEGGVVESLVVVEDVEEPAAAALEQGGLVEGEEEGEDVVEVDHDEAEVGVVGEGGCGVEVRGEDRCR